MSVAVPRAASVLWLRRDLRRADLPALGAAAGDGPPVCVAFVLDPALWRRAGRPAAPGSPRPFARRTQSYDGRLCLRLGDPRTVLPDLVDELGAASVHVSRETTPVGRRRDDAVRRALAAHRVTFVETGSPYAVGPGSVVNGTGGPYQVFTPFSRAWRDHGWPLPATEPERLAHRRGRVRPGRVGRRRRRAGRARPAHLPDAGEAAALPRWAEFLRRRARGIRTRSRPGRPRRRLAALALSQAGRDPPTHPARRPRRTQWRGAERFTTELAWREFYADVLWHHPDSAWHDLRPALRGMTYDDPQTELVEAWQRGAPATPSWMRRCASCAAEGWMHNRMRMVTASFLTKDLHVWWPAGRGTSSPI